MSDDPLVVPALSSTQDEAVFSFDKTTDAVKPRAHLSLPNAFSPDELIARIRDYYSLNDLVAFLRHSSSQVYQNITLQFPDKLVCDSAIIVHELQSDLGLSVDENLEATGAFNTRRLWILADTSYSTCCVDEVAAKHVDSDLVVHFGDACLNLVDSLPSAYIFGKPDVNLHGLVQRFRDTFPPSEYADKRILLMSDAPHTHALYPAFAILHHDYPLVAYADLSLPKSSAATIIGYSPHNPKGIRTLNRVICQFSEDSEHDSLDDKLLRTHLFHVTLPDAPRLLQLTTKFASVTIYQPDTDAISTGPFPNLMRRYRYMHSARTAGTIGLLVNTLSLAHTKRLMDKIGEKIKNAGKKHYTFVVGKPNVAKLANFENVDLWCVLGCDHQGIIVDQYNEYFRPIVTPYELLLALENDLTWLGKWETDFEFLIKTMENNKEATALEYQAEGEDAPPDFDSVTGKYVSSSRPLRRLEHLTIADSEDSSDRALMKKMLGTVSVGTTVSTLALHLQARLWKGLGSDFEEKQDDEGAVLEEGATGVARGYDFDASNASQRVSKADTS